MKYGLLILGAILVCAVSYYFVIALPAHNRARLELEREKFAAEKEEKEKKESADRKAEDQRRQALEDERLKREQDDLSFGACVDDADDIYWSYVKLNGSPVEGKIGVYNAPQYVWDAAAKRKQAAIDECSVRYKHR